MAKSKTLAKSSVSSRHKYASKYLDSIFESVIAKKLDGTDETKGKWIRKMRKSVLRKVSLLSQDLFKDNNAEISEDVAVLRAQLNQKLLALNQAGQDSIREVYELHKNYNVTGDTTHIETSANEILTVILPRLRSKMSELSSNIRQAEKDISNQAIAIGDTVAVVEDTITELLKRVKTKK